MTVMTLSRERHGLLVRCLAERAIPIARSPRFTLYPLNPSGNSQRNAGGIDDIIVVHDFAPSEIDNNIASYVADELLPLLAAGEVRRDAADGSAISDQDLFERLVGEIVRSVDGNETRAWHRFYDNTLTALERAGLSSDAGGGRAGALPAGALNPPKDYIGDFAAIYDRIAALIAEIGAESILDVATCFGFLPLLLASGAGPQPQGRRKPSCIVACDLNTALIALAAGYARHRNLTGLHFVEADILDPFERAFPQPSFDVVTAVHLLEHLDPAETGLAMDHLWRLTRRRLIVAVPVEEVPDSRFGHRQVFDRESLLALGSASGGICHGFEDHGAWLVIDRKPDAAVRQRFEEAWT